MSRRVLSIAAVLAIAGSALVAGAVTADTEMFPHPANVHEGSCLDVGAVVAPLGDVSSRLLVEGRPTLTDLADVPEFAVPVEASVTPEPGIKRPRRQRTDRARSQDRAVALLSVMSGRLQHGKEAFNHGSDLTIWGCGPCIG
jgi:hypothetical protein